MESLILKLNDQECIAFSAQVPIEQVCSLERVHITFQGTTHTYVLHDEDIDDALCAFIRVLKLVLANQIILTPDIANNISHLRNEHYLKSFGKRIIEPIPAEECYVLSSNNDKLRLETLIYNNVQGEIVLYIYELSYWKLLPDDFDEAQIFPDLLAEDYKPIIVRVISKETAHTWLKQCEYIWECVRKNVERYEQEHLRKRAEGRCCEDLEKALNDRIKKMDKKL